MGLLALTAMALADVPAYLALEQKHIYEDGHVCDRREDFAVNIGDVFTLSATLRTGRKDDIQVLFAKGPKAAFQGATGRPTPFSQNVPVRCLTVSNRFSRAC